MPGTAADDVVTFWRDAGEAAWFARDAAFDAAFGARFMDLHMAVAARNHDDWIATPEGALALLVLTDQFPRNVFRDTGHMYATDPLARHYARAAQARGHADHTPPALRPFLFLPFGHSENLADQDISVALCATLGEEPLSHAERHRGIIRRFGRFPHRNPMLGRDTTPEEARFLAEGGFSG